MKKVTVSAPGKLMLFGEHAVIYGRPCIVTAVSYRMKLTLDVLDKPIFSLDAPDVRVSNYKKNLDDLGKGDIPKGAQFVEAGIKNFTHERPGLLKLGGIKVTTISDFNSQLGFGSSSASAVCVLKALSIAFGVPLDNKALFDLAYKTVLDVQKKGSGFDIAAAIFGGTLYFVTGGKEIEALKVQSFPFVIGYSGVKADTVAMIDNVSKKAEREPDVVENIFDQIGKLVEEAKGAMCQEDWKKLGELMNKNQQLLKTLGVSNQKLDLLISAASNAGAYGAKLSGAGGGDCMISLLPKGEDRTKLSVGKAIEEVGGEVIDVNVNAQGVRIER